VRTEITLFALALLPFIWRRAEGPPPDRFLAPPEAARDFSAMRVGKTIRPGENESPVPLVKWHGLTRWRPGRVDNFPKNQRFILGQRPQKQRLLPT